MRPPETDADRLRWLLPRRTRLLWWVMARLTGRRIFFVYYDKPTEHYRLYFDYPERTGDQFFSIPWFKR